MGDFLFDHFVREGKKLRRHLEAERSGGLADPPLAALLDRWWSETLVQVDGVHPDAARVMLTRIAIMFEVVADRRGWSERMR